MPVNELILTLRGRSSRRRWLLVGRQFGVAAGIILLLAGAYWGLGFYHLVNWTGREERAEGLVRLVLALVSLLSGAAVVTLVLLAAWVARRRRARRASRGAGTRRVAPEA